MFQLSCYRPRLLRELFPLPLKGVVIIIKIAFGATVTFLFVCSLCILTFFLPPTYFKNTAYNYLQDTAAVFMFLPDRWGA